MSPKSEDRAVHRCLNLLAQIWVRRAGSAVMGIHHPIPFSTAALLSKMY